MSDPMPCIRDCINNLDAISKANDPVLIHWVFQDNGRYRDDMASQDKKGHSAKDSMRFLIFDRIGGPSTWFHFIDLSGIYNQIKKLMKMEG